MRVTFVVMGADSTEHPSTDRADDRAATKRPTVHVRRRLTVSEAAEELEISAEAVRSRVRRDTLRSVKEGGTFYVLLPTAQSRPVEDQMTYDRSRPNKRPNDARTRAGAPAELVESLLEQVAYMREQLAEEREARRRADTIMAQLSQANAEQARTIRALEAPHEPRNEPRAPETPADSPEGTPTPVDLRDAQEGVQRPSLWRRFFGA